MFSKPLTGAGLFGCYGWRCDTGCGGYSGGRGSSPRARHHGELTFVYSYSIHFFFVNVYDIRYVGECVKCT